MLLGAEAVGQQLGQRQCVKHTVFTDKIHSEIVVAELPYHLPAHTAGRKCAGDGAISAAADGDGRKIPVSVINRLENGGALGAVGGAVGCVFDIAALVHRAVLT